MGSTRPRRTLLEGSRTHRPRIFRKNGNFLYIGNSTAFLKIYCFLFLGVVKLGRSSQKSYGNQTFRSRRYEERNGRNSNSQAPWTRRTPKRCKCSYLFIILFTFLKSAVCLQVGVELVPLLKQHNTGKPNKDPSTGYMLRHSLSTTDVTRGKYSAVCLQNLFTFLHKLFDCLHFTGQDAKRPEIPAFPRHSPMEDKRMYYEELAGQVQSKYEYQHAKRKFEEEQQMNHFQHWDTFWGRPGN